MRIKIKGQAGQGVQIAGITLAKILTTKNYYIALTNDYSPLMKSGDSNAYLVVDKKPIDNPIVEEAELAYDLSEEKITSMELIGKILKKLEIEITDEDLEKNLPTKNKEENKKQIKKGLTS